MPDETLRVEIAFADFPVAAVLVDRRGKLLDTTAPAAHLVRQIPDLIARIAAVAVRASSRTDALRFGDDTIQLTLVTNHAATHDGGNVVFLVRARADVEHARDPLASLTPRQRDTALLAATGLRTAELAERLHCTERTVRAHLSACYHRLGVRSRIELTALIHRAP